MFDMVIAAAVSSVISAVTATIVLKVNQAWHKEKLDRHSSSLARAFTESARVEKEVFIEIKHLRKELNDLAIEFWKKWGDSK